MMREKTTFQWSRKLIGIFLILYLAGCSVSNADAPRSGKAHPPGFVMMHSAQADSDLQGCQTCHGSDFTGNGDPVPGCFACHDSGPPFTVHPLPYTDPQLHGPAAKANQLLCRGCHGNALNNFDGGIVSDPNYFNNPAGSCSAVACHPAARAHPTNWQGTNEDRDPSYDATHRSITLETVNTSCSLCHKTDGSGAGPNPKAPSCYSASFTNADGSTTGCHAGGSGAPHALPFTDPDLHGPEAKADLSYCQECHATPPDGDPGSNPRFNAAVGDMIKGCEDCHTQETAHPYPSWSGAASNSHKTAGNLAVACSLCHGANLLGPAEGGVARACSDCHTAGSPLVLSNCTSCHNDPPDGNPPAGNSRPNRDGAHSLHDALPKVSGTCASCHSGAGTNTSLHFDSSSPAGIFGPATYDAKSGIFSYNSSVRQCSNVSCHGGQTTPDWLTGSLDAAGDCNSCHERGTSQYNSYNSGRHRQHVEEERLFCTACHDANKLAADHFIGLDTSVFEGAAAETLRTVLNYHAPTNRGCNVGGCHGEHRWF